MGNTFSSHVQGHCHFTSFLHTSKKEPASKHKAVSMKSPGQEPWGLFWSLNNHPYLVHVTDGEQLCWLVCFVLAVFPWLLFSKYSLCPCPLPPGPYLWRIGDESPVAFIIQNQADCVCGIPEVNTSFRLDQIAAYITAWRGFGWLIPLTENGHLIALRDPTLW